jgi:hypothetical protein
MLFLTKYTITQPKAYATNTVGNGKELLQEAILSMSVDRIRGTVLVTQPNQLSTYNKQFYVFISQHF